MPRIHRYCIIKYIIHCQIIIEKIEGEFIEFCDPNYDMYAPNELSLYGYLKVFKSIITCKQILDNSDIDNLEDDPDIKERKKQISERKQLEEDHKNYLRKPKK